MTEDVATVAASSPPSPRRVALTLIPLIGIVVGIGGAILWALTAPSSGAPSDDGAIAAVVVMWVAVVACLLAASWTAASPAAFRLAVTLAALALLAALGWVVARRIDAAWVDACQFGLSGDRCVYGDDGAPRWVMVVWPAVGVVAAALCAGVAALGRTAADA